MSLLKLLAKAILMIGLIIEMTSYLVLAQLPPPNPSVAPLPPPVGPAQLPAPGQALAAPSLIALPTPTAAVPTPGPQVFNCSCSGAAVQTSWMGQVSASGFFAARQAATGACLAYNERRPHPPPLLATHQASAFGSVATLPQGFENPSAATAAGTTLPGTLTTSSVGQLAACSNCACN
ncbi:MAG TPA: hypothetical protein VKS22_14480 [Candidatus Binataceae bacterium]|nr:hypothetical protein [Candidatus Binataceae bacterium]